MKVSVVLCTYTPDDYEHFTDAMASLRAQTHEDLEIVVVVDGHDELCDRVHGEYGNVPAVTITCNEENVGLLESRNRGAEAASGDVVAFIDDDAIADERWVEKLVAAYEDRDVPAAGGKMVPEWVAGRPAFLPEEFYFLIGVTHRGFADGAGEVRNTNGSNISFRREAFLDLDGFNTEIGGRQGDANLQGGETELCARLREEYGQGVWYVPDAEVAHKVFEYRTDPKWLADRAFWQGYSKRGMEVLAPDTASDEEWSFLGRLLFEFVPDRLRGLVVGPSVERAKQFVALVVLTGLVGVGYCYGFTRYR